MTRAWVAALILAGGVASAQAPQKSAHAPEVDTAELVHLPFVFFDMGQKDEPIGRYGDPWFVNQQPIHTVGVSAFFIDPHEVTAADYALFLTWAGGLAHWNEDQPIERVRDGYLPMAGQDKRPMHQVRWADADAYCRWAGKRLPTEAEWERAAAGESGRTFPWGEDGLSCRRAVYFTGATFCEEAPADVRSRPEGATPEGVFELAGNVAEWTADWYGRYSADAMMDPTGPASGVHRVVRGGSFLEGGSSVRTRARRAVLPSLRSDAIGFRCVYRDDVPQPGVRGALKPAADVDRIPSTRRRAVAKPGPSVLAEGLQAPGALVMTPDEASWVALPQQGQVVRLDPNGGSSIELENAGAIVELVADGDAVIAVSETTGTLWRLRAGSAPEAWVVGEEAPSSAVVQGGELIFGTASAVRVRTSSGAVETRAQGLDGVAGVAADAGWIWFAEAGAASAANARIARVPRGGGPVETIVSSQQLGFGMRPKGLALREDGSGVYAVQMSGFPNSSLLCTVQPDGSMRRCDYGPTHFGRLTVRGEVAYWTTHHAVARLDLGTRLYFELPGTWARAGGLFVEDGGAVRWTDALSGKLLRNAPTP